VDAWRAVIDLNLVRSVTFLLRLLDEDPNVVTASPIASSSTSSSAAVDTGRNSSGSGSGSGSGSITIGVGLTGRDGDVDNDDDDARPLSPTGTKLVPLQRLTDDLRRLRVSLSPLRSIEESLVRFISPDAPRHLGGGAMSGVIGGGGAAAASVRSAALLPTERAFEVSVRSGSRWKSLFKGGAGAGAGSGSISKASGRGYDELLNARRVIEACREDIVALWNHPAVRASLAEQSVALEFQSGLYVVHLFPDSPGRLLPPVILRLRLPSLPSPFLSPFRLVTSTDRQIDRQTDICLSLIFSLYFFISNFTCLVRFC
jgi:guanine nucleotide-binding protein subunit alpha